jgi:transcriptional regulator with GAF, ATPase, and Fis domain
MARARVYSLYMPQRQGDTMKASEGTALHKVMHERVIEHTKTLRPFSSDNGPILTESPQILRIIDVARRVAATDVPVLLLGESGVWKDVFAHFIHNQSNRFGNPFVKVNCAALPDELLESEFFGHDKGAFTGAVQDRPGRFEKANRGTLFLDEIAEMSPHLQAKLLHVLQDGKFSRLGSRWSTNVDVRILAATNRKLKEAVLNGEFRSDLYFRLNVIQLQIPPLRSRREDIPTLNFEMDYKPRPVTPDTTAPANVFYLKQVGRRAADDAERGIVLRVLDETGWNRKECAKRLHISYKALRVKLKRWELKRCLVPPDQKPVPLDRFEFKEPFTISAPTSVGNLGTR